MGGAIDAGAGEANARATESPRDENQALEMIVDQPDSRVSQMLRDPSTQVDSMLVARR